ncbi:MAG TPA: hypothetical protein VFZ87_12965, partial [Gemmatimonadales bacterium]
MRGSTRRLRLYTRSSRRIADVLMAGDLGLLLSRCDKVVVRKGTQAALLESELLIQWRVLQVVTATPYLPCPHRLIGMFPSAEINQHGFQVPTGSCPPEAV